MVRRLFLSLLVGLLLVFLLVGNVWAISDPTSTGIGDVYVFRSVLTTDDQLCFVRYSINYGSVPSEPASTAFQMAIYGVDGITLLFARPVNYYQENIISIYLTPAQASAMTWEAAYVIRVQGNPALFGVLTEGVNRATITLNAGNYHEKADLAGIMISQATILQADWGITLLTAADLLNATGTTYFTKAVPQLSAMVPSIFQTTSYTYSEPEKVGNQTYIDRIRTSVAPNLASAVNGTASIFGASEGGAGFWMACIIGLVFGGIVYAATKRPDWSVVFAVVGIGVVGFAGVGSQTFTAFLWVLLAAGVLFGILWIGRNLPF